MLTRLRRHALFALLLLSLLALLQCSKGQPEASDSASPSPAKLRIGYQKSGTLSLLKWRGTLEPELERRGGSLEWAEFPSGPALLEAMNAAQIDFGFVGEAPPIFAQAAASNMVYVATEPAAPKSEAILVRSDSPLKELRDLKGRSVALNKGSNVHYFLVRALERAKLAYTDVKVVFLPPADARAAFETGTVDAWAIWDPYLAAAQLSLSPRVLATAEGIAPNQQLYIARREFAERSAPLLELVLQHLKHTDAWVSGHTAEASERLAQQLNIDARAVQLSLERATFQVGPISEEVLDNQQRIADAFLELGLVPRALRVRDALPERLPRP